MKTYNTLEEIFQDAKPHQVTAQELINGRSRLNDQWQPFEITEELKDKICVRLAEIYGGQTKTQDRVYRTLMRGTPQHWGLGRTVVEYYQEFNQPAKLHYIAGQSMPEEIREIRNALKK